MRRRFATWLWVALVVLTLQGAVWAQSPTAATSPAPASAAPAAVTSSAPAVAAPAAVASAAPASAAPAAPASAAPASAPPASGLPASGLPAVSGSPATAATTNPAPALPQITEIQPPTEAQEIHPKSVARTIIEDILLIAYFILCLGLIVCVMFTNTKNEGLTGIIGGGSTASPVFKGKKSAEETLAQWTARLSWAFLFSSLGIWLIMSG